MIPSFERSPLRVIAVAVCLALVLAACSETEANGPRLDQPGTRELHHRHEGFPHYVGHFETVAISSIPHESSIETNGLEWVDGSLYESGGGDGKSTLRRIDATTGDVIEETELDVDDTTSGLTYYNNRFYLVSRDSGQAIVYDAASLDEVDRVGFSGEAWGVCVSSDKFFVTSDGTSTLTVRNVETFESEREFTVSLDDKELTGLMELECIGDQIWATITDPDNPQNGASIVVINIDTEEIEATIDASEIVSEEFEDRNLKISGIALRASDRSLWLKGSGWSATFEVGLTPATER